MSEQPKQRTGIRWKRRALELSLLGLTAGFAVACSTQIADMAGMLAEDAGELMIDAGAALRDSSTAMLDASGELLDDAGHLLRDAGQGLQDGSHQMARDARAQEACATCTDSGAQRVISAPDDPAQWMRWSVSGNAWTVDQVNYENSSGSSYIAWIRYADFGAGPLMVTDVVRSIARQRVYVLPSDVPCVATSGTETSTAKNVPSQAINLASGSELAQHGARLHVLPHEHLCAYDNGFAGPSGYQFTPEQSPPGQFVVSGFRPYD
jgi:hypothetical protein